MTDTTCICTHLDVGLHALGCPVHRPPMMDYAAWDEMRDINVGLQEENDTLRADLQSATTSYRTYRLRAETAEDRLGTLLSHITLGECLICGSVPTQDHRAECPVPRILEEWDNRHDV